MNFACLPGRLLLSPSLTKRIRIAALAGISLLALTSAEPARAECADAVTTVEMRACAAQEYEAADAELNAVYAQVKAAVSKEVMGYVREAQRAWIPFRDAACSAEAAPYAGGTIQPQIGTDCKTRLTQRRADDLRALLPN